MKYQTEEETERVLQVQRAANLPLDAVFVTAEQVDVNVFPPPVAFLVKTFAGESKVVVLPEGNRDFLLQRQDLYEAGLTLYGPPARELLHPVPWPLLAQSLDYLLPHIIASFKNPVLMLCRIAYAHNHRSLCSKTQAGVWAAEALDARWKPLIQTALSEYARGVTPSAIPKESVGLFEKWCEGYMLSVS